MSARYPRIAFPKRRLYVPVKADSLINARRPHVTNLADQPLNSFRILTNPWNCANRSFRGVSRPNQWGYDAICSGDT